MASKYPSWATERLLNFINLARSAEGIYASPLLQDDPKQGSVDGYVIGEKTAQKIIEHKQSLPRRRYEKLEDLQTVSGLGADKLNDLLFSFSLSADEAFTKSLFAELIGENWELNQKTIDYPSEDAFNEVVNNGENFRRVVATLYADSFQDYPISAIREMEIRVHRAHQENYTDSHLGAFQFAFWWYLFDYDNWFSYDKMKTACENYLNYHGNNGIQFRVIYLGGYLSITEYQKGLTLPVVVNYAERRITLWDAILRD